MAKPFADIDQIQFANTWRVLEVSNRCARKQSWNWEGIVCVDAHKGTMNKDTVARVNAFLLAVPERRCDL